jgi:hypothetical protein
MKRLAFAALTLAACGGGTETRDYQLHDFADKSKVVPVRVTVPKAWKQELDDTGAPSFEPTGEMFPSATVLAVGGCGDKTGQACLDWRIGVENPDSKPQRTQQGAVIWTHEANPKNGGGIDVRYAYDAPSGLIVKCVVMRPGADDPAPLRAACDSIVVRP